jgi:hypothetical protein
LAEEDDFEVVIGWGQASPFLSTEIMLPTTNNLHGTTRLPTDFTESWNGVLEVDVVNSLVAPAADTDISFNVYVSCVPDIKFAAPQPNNLSVYSLFPEQGDPLKTIPEEEEDITQLLSKVRERRSAGYTPQSGTVEEAPTGTTMNETDIPVDPGAVQDIAVTSEEVDQTMNVFFGESPKSLRDLFRRYVHHRLWVFEAPPAGAMIQSSLSDRAIGYWNGYDPEGLDTHLGFPATITIPHFVHWFSPCYAAWRGGLRTKYVFDNNQHVMPTVSRSDFMSNTGITNHILTDTDPDYLTRRLTYASHRRTAAGAASTNLGVNNTIEVETPFYHPARFMPARLPRADVGNGSSTNVINMLGGSDSFGPTTPKLHSCATWKSVGEDFSLFFFTGCPIVYLSGIVVNPV